MKSFIKIISLIVLLVSVAACSEKKHGYVGTFTDQFQNTFVLNADKTATITFHNMTPIQTTWEEVNEDGLKYAAILFNGDKNYFTLRDGSLYYGVDNMKEGKLKISIQYK